jgi:hypothetical protein
LLEANAVPQGREGVGRSVVLVEADRSLEHRAGLFEPREIEAIEQVETAQHVFISVKAVGAPVTDAAQLGLPDMRRDRLQDPLGKPILQREQIAGVALEPVGRDHRAAFHIGHFGRDPQAVAAASHCARTDVADPKLASDCLNVGLRLAVPQG